MGQLVFGQMADLALGEVGQRRLLQLKVVHGAISGITAPRRFGARALVLLAAWSRLSKSWGTTLLFQKINGELIRN
jgi:hypothetical protein